LIDADAHDHAGHVCLVTTAPLALQVFAAVRRGEDAGRGGERP